MKKVYEYNAHLTLYNFLSQGLLIANLTSCNSRYMYAVLRMSFFLDWKNLAFHHQACFSTFGCCHRLSTVSSNIIYLLLSNCGFRGYTCNIKNFKINENTFFDKMQFRLYFIGPTSDIQFTFSNYLHMYTIWQFTKFPSPS